MSSWTTSKPITDKSWAILKQNRYLLAFPVMGIVLALIPMAVFWLPAAYFLNSNQNWLGFGAIVLGVFAIQFVFVLMSAGLVAAADAELAGRDASFGYGVSKATGRLGALLQWSVILTIVTFILGLLRGNNQGGLATVVLRNVLAAAAGVMWQLVTFFVLPFIMLEQKGAMSAIKESSTLFRERWGMQILGGVRIGARIGLLFILPGLVLVVAGVFILSAGTALAGVPLIVIGILLWSLGALLMGALKGVFTVALFHYAKDGTVLADFTPDELLSAVRTRATV